MVPGGTTSGRKATKQTQQMAGDMTQSNLVDMASADSMDASDPPFFTPSTAGRPAAKISRETRIREKAYTIWEAEGLPHGRHEAHWLMAEELIAIEDDQAGPTSAVRPIPIIVAETASERPDRPKRHAAKARRRA